MYQKSSITDWAAMTDKAIVNHICSQIRQIRLERNITQEQLSERSGLGRATISRIEKGQSISLLTLIQLLRALDSLELLNAFSQAPTSFSPMQLLMEPKPQRYRASGNKNSSDKGPSEW